MKSSKEKKLISNASVTAFLSVVSVYTCICFKAHDLVLMAPKSDLVYMASEV